MNPYIQKMFSEDPSVSITRWSFVFLILLAAFIAIWSLFIEKDMSSTVGAILLCAGGLKVGNKFAEKKINKEP
jgi:hypothetical protein